MIPTHIVPYGNGELRIGWASWDIGKYEERSIKYAYRDCSGKISRGSPELPFEVLLAMLLLAAEQGELDEFVPKAGTGKPPDVSQVSLTGLEDEEKTLSVVLMRIQGLIAEFRWANWQPIYDELGARLEEVIEDLTRRRLAQDDGDRRRVSR